MKDIEKAKNAMKGVNHEVNLLLNGQRACVKNFISERGYQADFENLKKDELIPMLRENLGQGVYRILMDVLGEFGLKAPDKGMMENLDYVIKNQNAVEEAMRENGASDEQVQGAISVAQSCFAQMQGLYDKVEEVANILVESDIKNKQKEQQLLAGGIALATMSVVSAAGSIAAGVFTILTISSGGMFPVGLFLGTMLLGPVLIASFGGAAFAAFDGAVDIAPEDFKSVEKVKEQISNFTKEQVAYYKENVPELEKVREQVGKISEKLERVHDDLKDITEQWQKQDKGIRSV